MSRLHGIAALIVASASCAVSGCTWNRDADAVSADDRRILRALVDISCKVGVDRIVVSDRPAVPRAGSAPGAGPHNVQFGIDFNRRLAQEARWPTKQVCPTVRVVDDSSLERALAREDKTAPTWDRFSAEFGGARTLMRISLPVYSNEGDHAVVYSENTCPFTCGTGFYHELKKERGHWRIETSKIAWTS